MALLKSPGNQDAFRSVKGLIYGQPGIGKSTTALSHPNSVMIDLDDGMHRVQPQHRVPSLTPTSYEQVLELIQGEELRPYQNIVIDTAGKLLDLMNPYIIAQNPKNNGRAGGALTRNGYGVRKYEFQRFLAMVQATGKHLTFVAHEKEDKNNDLVFIRPDIGGSSSTDLAKELDFIGYMEAYDGKRTISFNPTERFYAKNSINLEGHIVLPDTNISLNNFLEKEVVHRLKVKHEETREIMVKYEDLVLPMLADIAGMETPEKALELFHAIKEHEPIWDSAVQFKLKFREKCAELGFDYDKEKEIFYVHSEDNTVDSE